MRKQLVIVHIGKCGGGSIADAIKDKLINAKSIHVKKPGYTENSEYIILIRDPISRFISAFNWKLFRCTTDEGMNYQGMPKPRGKNEIQGYKYWKSIENFAENLYNENDEINPLALKLIQSSNHLKYDINFYLSDLLPFMTKHNCKLIRCEHFDRDVKRVLGISSIGNQNHVYNKNLFSSYLTPRGKENLRRLLEKDYKCIYELREKGLIGEKYFNKIYD